MSRRITLTYFGIVAGFGLLVLISYSVWLEMRVHAAPILPALAFAGFTASFFIRKTITPYQLITLQAAILLLLLYRFDFDSGALAVIPAIWFREGFLLLFFDTGTINVILIALLILGNLASVSAIWRD